MHLELATFDVSNIPVHTWTGNFAHLSFGMPLPPFQTWSSRSELDTLFVLIIILSIHWFFSGFFQRSLCACAKFQDCFQCDPAHAHKWMRQVCSYLYQLVITSCFLQDGSWTCVPIPRFRMHPTFQMRRGCHSTCYSYTLEGWSLHCIRFWHASNCCTFWPGCKFFSIWNTTIRFFHTSSWEPWQNSNPRTKSCTFPHKDLPSSPQW